MHIHLQTAPFALPIYSWRVDGGAGGGVFHSAAWAESDVNSLTYVPLSGCSA